MVEELEINKLKISVELDRQDLEALKKTKSRKEFERLAKKVFEATDTDNSGYIDSDEMLQLILILLPEEEREAA
jgi:Ca2+-binding EF-hand superfamily protein